jgi:hypothetical protein
MRNCDSSVAGPGFPHPWAHGPRGPPPIRRPSVALIRLQISGVPVMRNRDWNVDGFTAARVGLASFVAQAGVSYRPEYGASPDFPRCLAAQTVHVSSTSPFWAQPAWSCCPLFPIPGLPRGLCQRSCAVRQTVNTKVKRPPKSLPASNMSLELPRRFNIVQCWYCN